MKTIETIRAGTLLFLCLSCLELMAQTPHAFSVKNLANLPSLPIAPDTLAIFLVEFEDVTHAGFDSAGYQVPFNRVYRWRDFYNMFATRNFYHTDRTGIRSPDGEPVFGSFLDYFAAMSNGLCVPAVQIMNDSTAEGLPEWIQLGTKKTDYFGSVRKWEMLYHHTVEKAGALGYDVRVTPQRRLWIIFAGNRRGKGAKLFGYCDYKPMARFFLAPERWTYTAGANDYDEARQARLAHIGVHCHEFAHMLGARHHYVYLWDMMGNGQKNRVKGGFGNCPAPINPWFRGRRGWLDLQPLECGQPVELIYGNSSRNYYIWSTPDSSRFILFEHRQYTKGFDRGLPGHEQGLSGGLLIWKINRDFVDLIEADGSGGEGNAEYDIFRTAVETTNTTPRHLGAADIPVIVTGSTVLRVEHVRSEGDTLEIVVKCP